MALAQRHAVVTICTVRRVEDAVASWMEIFGSGEDVAIDGMRAWLALYRQIRPFALTIPYALLDTHPFRASWRIARHVAADAGVLEVRRACTKTRKAAVKGATDRMDVTTPNMVDIGFSAYDTETYFHRRHVSTLVSRPAEQRVSSAQLHRIRIALADDIAASGLDALLA